MKGVFKSQDGGGVEFADVWGEFQRAWMWQEDKNVVTIYDEEEPILGVSIWLTE
jgi:hypothetical protein